MALRVMIDHGRQAGIAGFCAAALLTVGCGVSQPGRAESAVITWIKHRITVGGGNDKNPLGHGPAIAREGETAFDAYCIVCHGLDGQNTGIPFAGQISPPIPSLAAKQVQEYTDGQLKWIIENGISPSGMPASRGILSDEEVWSIVEFLRHLPPKGSLGEPGVYSGNGSDGQGNQSLLRKPPGSRPLPPGGPQRCAHS